MSSKRPCAVCRTWFLPDARVRRRQRCCEREECRRELHRPACADWRRRNRFWCKVFLTEALRYFGGAAARCMLDNSTVVVATGTGKNAVPAPEMAPFAESLRLHLRRPRGR